MNIELFISEWEEIISKLEAISKIPKLWKGFGRNSVRDKGNTFMGVDIDDGGIQYKTADCFNGCDDNYFNIYIPFEDLAKPLSFFEEKYRKEIQAWEEETRRADFSKQAMEKEREKEQYERLKRIYGQP